MPAPENVHQHRDDVRCREHEEHILIARRRDEPSGNAAAKSNTDVISAEESGVSRAALGG